MAHFMKVIHHVLHSHFLNIFVFHLAPIASVLQPFTSGDSCPSSKDATTKPSTTYFKVYDANTPTNTLCANLSIYVVVLQTFPEGNPEDV